MSASPAASPAASSTPGAIFANPEQLLSGIWLMLGFGLLAIAVVVIFILLAQRRYFQAVEYLARRGMISSPGKTEATITGLHGALDTSIVLAGPEILTIGQAGEYSAKTAGQPTAVTWTVDPPDRAKVDPTTAADSVKVTASTAGPLKITGTAGSQGSADLHVAAQKAPESVASVLGYIGSGWGSVVVAILVAAVVGALGLAKVLDGQAVAGLFGSLLGYLFGVVTRASGGASGQGGQAGGTGGTGGGAP